MHCEQANEMMSLRLDGRLDETKAAVLDEHLSRCTMCQVQWQRLQRLHRGLASAPMLKAPVRLRVNVMTHLSRQDRTRRAVAGGLVLALGTVALALIAIVPAILGLLNTTGIAPALLSGGPVTVAHVLDAWEAVSRTLVLVCKNAAVPLVFLGLCGLLTVLALNGLWIGMLRRLRAR